MGFGAVALNENQPLMRVSGSAPVLAVRDKRVTHTLVISDVHLGSPVCQAGRLLQVLETWKFRRLILLGDIFEDFNLGRLQKDHWQVLSEIRRLSKPGRGIEVVWIEGNHDRLVMGVMSRLLGIRVHKRYRFRIGGRNIMAVHGDQFDYFLIDNPIITDVASRIYLTVQKYGGSTQRFSRAIKKRSKKWLQASNRVARRALDFGREVGADIVLCGHTHQPMMRQHGAVTYYNSGCWTDIPSTYLTIDDDGVTMHEC